MRRLVSSLCVCLAALVAAVSARSAVGNRLLVVLEDESQKSLYSKFWADLEARDFQISFESPRNEQLSLFRHGELAYEHLLLTPPKSKGYGPALTPKILLEFTNAGGNTLLALSSETGTPSAISSLLLEFDVSLPPERTSVVADHFNYDTLSAADKHDVLVLPRPGPLRADVVNFFGGEGVIAAPNTVGHTLGNGNPLLSPILRAPATAYAYNPKEETTENIEDPFATGSQLALISALQARNSARFTILGSIELLQDKWFDASVKAPAAAKASKTVNREFAQQITEWTFKEVGVLAVVDISHHQVALSKSGNATQIGDLNPEIYRIKNDVTFSIAISEYDRTSYRPFHPPSTDALQLEFSMLSPFQRLALVPAPIQPSADATLFTTTFRTPDQHGIFAFRVNYKRPFLTSVEEKRQVTLRHFAHDEWPRSWAISGAWPWVTGLWTVVGGFLFFVLLWLYSAPPKGEVERRRKLSVSSR